MFTRDNISATLSLETAFTFHGIDLSGYHTNPFHASIEFGCIDCYAAMDYSFYFSYSKNTDETPLRTIISAVDNKGYDDIYGRPNFIKVTGDVALALLTIAKKSNPSIATYSACTCHQQQQKEQRIQGYGDIRSGGGYGSRYSSNSHGYGY
ncbi:hypothetical protein H4219_005008 [Mycoemilia scoparia]|uniref:Uncharacterized protein n=1 Tax=Mycoemilia scoparia TaxID=417184 RepID=A0A9W7ZPM5_9FUNG|nr:hypothetical protein H4219_005008 [Mycoemilia scoparia]